MKFIEQIERLQYLCRLISKECTGSPEEFSSKLGIRRSQLYNLIGYLNDLGMKIKFCRSRNTFKFESPNEAIEIVFTIKVISAKNSRIIYGGGCFSIVSPANFYSDML